MVLCKGIKPKHVCSICQKEFLYKSKLDRHMSQLHCPEDASFIPSFAVADHVVPHTMQPLPSLYHPSAVFLAIEDIAAGFCIDVVGDNGYGYLEKEDGNDSEAVWDESILIEKPCESTSVLPFLQSDEWMSVEPVELVEQPCKLITGPDGDNSEDNSDDTYDAYSINEDAKDKRFQWKISDISHAIRKLNVEEKTEVLRRSLHRETGECLAEIVH